MPGPRDTPRPALGSREGGTDHFAADGPDQPDRGPGRRGDRRRLAFISWAAFTATFAGVRAVTYAVRRGAAPDLESSGVHLHHYLWGIGLLAAAGGTAVHGSEEVRLNPTVAAAYGAGSALVIDELALLIHFKDVYWSKPGRVSVLLAMVLIGGTGVSFVIVPSLRHRAEHAARVTEEAAGL